MNSGDDLGSKAIVSRKALFIFSVLEQKLFVLTNIMGDRTRRCTNVSATEQARIELGKVQLFSVAIEVHSMLTICLAHFVPQRRQNHKV